MIHSVYRCYNKRGALIYVGMSWNFPKRLREHAAQSPWYAEICDVKMRHFDDELSARIHEMKTIRKELPKYNIMYASLKP